MSEYIYQSHGEPLVNERGEIYLARAGEIVRCKDCEYRHEGMCMLTDGMGDFKRWFVDDDDYCSDGEKAVGA